MRYRVMAERKNGNILIGLTPTGGGVFDSWSDGETSPTRTVTITDGLSLTAKFK